MTSRVEENLQEIAEDLESISLERKYQRRVAVKLLYDYFQILTLEVAVCFCGLNRDSVKSCHLATRWKIVTDRLGLVEDPKKWDKFVNELSDMREKVEHNDYAYPEKTSVLRVKGIVSDFRTWIVKTGNEYHEKSSGWSFIQKFVLVSQSYITQADWMLRMYGEEPPYSAKSDTVLPGDEPPYKRLSVLRSSLDSRTHELGKIEDLKNEDIDNLVDLVREVERLDAIENVLIRLSICPKCGGKIVETQNNILSGNPEDPEVHAIFYRVGCEKCDYELNSETIDV
jgi:uncharacterized protein with PIN domain